MGKYATYRMRGGGQPLTRPLGPPEPPVMSEVDSELAQTSASASNVGGLLTLQFSTDGLPPWDLEDTAPWTPVKDWGSILALPAGFYRAFEEGNGIDYLGTSDKSNTFEIEP